MEKKSQHLEDRILEYLDGQLTGSEKQAFEKLLLSNPALRMRTEQLRMTDAALRKLIVEQPSKNFTTAVMNRLDDYPAKARPQFGKSILLLAGVMIVAGIAVLLLSMGVFDSLKTIFDPNTLAIKNKYIQKELPTIPFDIKDVVNSIIFLNIVLALIVLDRTILKPFFQRRMESNYW